MSDLDDHRPADSVGAGTALPGGGAAITEMAADAGSLRDVMAAGGSTTLVVLTLIRLFESLEGQALAVLGPDLQRSLGLSDTALGGVGAIGALAVIAGALPLGYLADRRRRDRITVAATATAAVFAALTAAAVNVGTLVLARIGSGFGKAATLPVHSSLLADAYPVGGRARVFAVHNLAAPAAAIAGPALLGAIATAAGPDGWRTAVAVVTVPLAILAAVALLLREPVRGGQEQQTVLDTEVPVDSGPPISYATGVARLRRIPTLSWLLLGVGVLGFVLVSVPTFLSLFLEDRFGLDARGRGLAVSVTEIGAFVGVLVGGAVGERLLRSSPERALLSLGAGTAIYGAVFTGALYLPGRGPVLAGVAVANLFLYAATVPIYAYVAAVVPYRLRALGYALLGLSIFLVGGFLGGVITGLLSDARGTRFALTVVTLPACLVAGALTARGTRSVRADMAEAVREVREEEEVRARRAAVGGPPPVLAVRNLDVSYGPVQVLFDVSLDVADGEVLALLGTNGAGKSTILRAISGLVVGDRGVVRLDGANVTYASTADRVDLGIVQMPGGKAVFGSMTVTENLLAGCHRFAWDRAEVARRVEASLELFPALDALGDQRAGSLSGGEQQMLALAKALLLQPRLLLIDELSLGLAPVAVAALLDAVRVLKDRGVAMVLVEQSVNVALSVADRAVFLERGRVRFDGPAADLAGRDDLLRAVFLGGEGG